ncbi:MAG: hypothetical protein WD048_02410 [Chitinophagales bacterium]
MNFKKFLATAKYIVIISFMAILQSFVFYESVGFNKVHSEAGERYPALQYEWSNWATTSCYRGIRYRVKRDSYPGKWYIEFKNIYQAELTMSVEIVDGYAAERFSISSGDSRKRSYWLNDKNANNIEFYINKVKFNDRSWGGTYADCDH